MHGSIDINIHSKASTISIDKIEPSSLTIDPKPLIDTGRNWTQWAGPLISLLILAATFYQLRAIDMRSIVDLVPQTPYFWLLFAAYYLAGPLSEWVIFRRLWSLPAGGFAALLRKLVSNEILLGYLGEVYFYAWARRNAQITTAPFGAIKDVTILSALTGNIFTIILVILSAPLFGSLHLGIDSNAFAGSTVFVLGSSIAMLVLRKRLFTLPPPELRFVAILHMLRIVAMTVLAAAMWHTLLPGVALSWWVLLGALRQLLSRLPFVPNKDIVFAGLASFFVGRDVQIVAAMTLMATLILAAHLLIGAALGAAELSRAGRAR